MERIDTRGRACPEPVLLTKKALQNHAEGIIVVTDNETATQNVTRFAENAGYRVSSQSEGEDTLLTISK